MLLLLVPSNTKFHPTKTFFTVRRIPKNRKNSFFIDPFLELCDFNRPWYAGIISG